MALLSYKRPWASKPPFGTRQNLAHPLSSELSGRWLCNEGGGGIVHDVSGRGNNGTLNGPTWITSTGGLALDFDGSNDYVNIEKSESLDFGTGNFSVSFWLSQEILITLSSPFL